MDAMRRVIGTGRRRLWGDRAVSWGGLRRLMIGTTLLCLMAVSTEVAAQDQVVGTVQTPPDSTVEPGAIASQAGLLVLNFDRVFALSSFGRRVERDIQAAGRALIDENASIEAELTAEELLLTAQRDTLPIAEFRLLAEAFDAKVQDIRARQDAKARNIAQGREAEERRFRQLVTPIVAAIMKETGAVAVLDRDQVVFWADAIDITERVVAQTNLAIGDGIETLPSADTGEGDGEP